MELSPLLSLTSLHLSFVRRVPIGSCSVIQMDCVTLETEMESSLGIEEFSLLADLLTNVDDDEGSIPPAQSLGLQSKS